MDTTTRALPSSRTVEQSIRKVVTSAPPAERHKRRGVAGDLVVFKVAAAAATEGRSLDEVPELAGLANDRTRSLGVRLSGCTLPGSALPLFSVPEGRMAVGLNGLGLVRYEELFVVYGQVQRLLDEAGVEVVEPEVGEVCTSFDVAGVSLTLLWLDDDLERLWGAPADAPAFRKCSVDHTAATVEFAEVEESAVLTATASEESRAGSARVVEIFGTIAQTIDEHADELGRAEVGDKTLVDVLVPFDETLTEAVECGASFVEAWQQATAAAAHAAEGTKDLLPRMGRARPHDAERSLGTPDAGAVSLSLIVDAIGKVLPVEPATKVSI